MKLFWKFVLEVRRDAIIAYRYDWVWRKNELIASHIEPYDVRFSGLVDWIVDGAVKPFPGAATPADPPLQLSSNGIAQAPPHLLFRGGHIICGAVTAGTHQTLIQATNSNRAFQSPGVNPLCDAGACLSTGGLLIEADIKLNALAGSDQTLPLFWFENQVLNGRSSCGNTSPIKFYLQEKPAAKGHTAGYEAHFELERFDTSGSQRNVQVEIFDPQQKWFSLRMSQAERQMQRGRIRRWRFAPRTQRQETFYIHAGGKPVLRTALALKAEICVTTAPDTFYIGNDGSRNVFSGSLQRLVFDPNNTCWTCFG